jgi:hypothetical protein
VTRRNKRSLDAMLKAIAPFVRPRQLVEWRTTGQWQSVPAKEIQRWRCLRCGKRICEERGGAYSFFRCRCDAEAKTAVPEDDLIEDVVLPFRPNYTVTVPVRLRVVGPLEPDDAALEECDDVCVRLTCL